MSDDRKRDTAITASQSSPLPILEECAMLPSPPDFAIFFRDRTALSVHRASTELRAGRPILVDAPTARL